MVERKGDVPDLDFAQLAGPPDDAVPAPEYFDEPNGTAFTPVSQVMVTVGYDSGSDGPGRVCIRCGRKLRSKRSIAIGMGPVCAKRA
ncbi:DUF6011 domain-containing protein [Plantactinospora veratri]